MISKTEEGSIMAEGELSTRIMIFPSKIEAAAVSGRSENLNLGNGLNHLCRRCGLGGIPRQNLSVHSASCEGK